MSRPASSRLQKDGIHVFQRDGLASRLPQEALQIPNVDSARTDLNRSVSMDDEIDRISRFELQKLANRLRQCDLALARQRGSRHSLLYSCFLTYGKAEAQAQIDELEKTI